MPEIVPRVALIELLVRSVRVRKAGANTEYSRFMMPPPASFSLSSMANGVLSSAASLTRLAPAYDKREEPPDGVIPLVAGLDLHSRPPERG